MLFLLFWDAQCTVAHRKNPKLITKLIKIFRNCEIALKHIQLEIPMTTETVVEKKIKKFLKYYKFFI